MSTRVPAPRTQAELAALVHVLEVQQAEMQLQNLELISSNEELRRSNTALAFACERYRILHELAPAPLVTLDPEGVIVDVNHAAEVLLGSTRQHLAERRFAQFVADAEREEVRALLAELFRTGVVRRVESLLIVDDTLVEVVIDGVTLPDVGRMQAVLALVDVTKRNRAEHERGTLALRSHEAQRVGSLAVLASGVAHDFNNLLTVVLASADHVLHTIESDSPVTRPLVELRHAARQAGDLAHKMLAYAGKGSSLVRATDVAALLREAEVALRATAGSTPLELEILDDVPWVAGDPAQLRQILHNLVSNAAEAMHRRAGTITVTARRANLVPAQLARLPLAGALAPGPYLALEVRDQGVGMDSSIQSRIFEPYYSTKFAGRGLGLAVVQGVVRSHRGAINVESRLDHGTTFRVYLPAVPAESPSPAADPRAVVRRSPLTVLIVDDEPVVRGAMARLARAFGYNVYTATGGLEAIEVARAAGDNLDLVLMDLTMPEMGGVAAATELRALRANLPIVLVTGFGEIPPDAGRLFTGLLTKPFDLARMRAAIEHALASGAPDPGAAA